MNEIDYRTHSLSRSQAHEYVDKFVDQIEKDLGGLINTTNVRINLHLRINNKLTDDMMFIGLASLHTLLLNTVEVLPLEKYVSEGMLISQMADRKVQRGKEKLQNMFFWNIFCSAIGGMIVLSSSHDVALLLVVLFVPITIFLISKFLS